MEAISSAQAQEMMQSPMYQRYYAPDIARVIEGYLEQPTSQATQFTP